MKREEFAHAVRAAGAVLGVDELLVIGSQALHASDPAPGLGEPTGAVRDTGHERRRGMVP